MGLTQISRRIICSHRLSIATADENFSAIKNCIIFINFLAPQEHFVSSDLDFKILKFIICKNF